MQLLLPIEFHSKRQGAPVMKMSLILAGAVAAALAAPVIGATGAAAADNEKCYGVAAAGQNDCQSAGNSCAGQVTSAARSDAWIYVPAGTCTKINGGSLEPKQS
ncbi:MAG: BufA1 family periplasmic bufferin-type metallophore [Dongiaceae bacterium]